MKKIREIMSIVLCLMLCLAVIPFGTVVQAESDMYTVWQADPYLAGFESGETVSFSSTDAGYTSQINTTVNKDDNGYYYSVNATRNGWSYVESGVNSATVSWLRNKTVIKTIQPYLEFSYDYRIKSEAETTNGMSLFIWACGGWTSNLAKLSYSKVNKNSDWTTVTGNVGAFADSDGWGNGWIAFNPYGCTDYSNSYTIDIRNIKLRISSENKKAVNDALTAAGITDITFDTIVSYNEFVYDKSLDDTEVQPESDIYTVWQADPYLAGFESGETVSFSSTDAGYTSQINTTVNKDDNGYYYSVNATRNGWSYVESGVNSATVSWLRNKTVIKAIQPYLEFSYDYRIKSEAETTNGMSLFIWACGGWTSNLTKLSYSKVNKNSDWTTVTGNVGAFADSDGWGNGWIAFNPYGCTDYSNSYTIDIRNIKLRISSENKKAVNDALTAAGITDITFDTIVSYNEFVYGKSHEDKEYKIYNASAANLSAENGESATPVLNTVTSKYTAYKVINSDSTYYHTEMSAVGFGGQQHNTVLSSGLYYDDYGYGWLGSKEILNAIKPYLNFSVEYRCSTGASTGFTDDAKLKFYAADGYSLKIAQLGLVDIKNVAGWQTYSAKLPSDSFTSGWAGGNLSVSIQALKTGGLYGGQTVDIKNVTLSIRESDRYNINRALINIGSTVRFEDLALLDPSFVREDIIWYASPDKVAKNVGDSVTAIVSSSGTPAKYDTVKMLDNSGCYYRTEMNLTNTNGGANYNAVINSGLSSSDIDYGWMANTDFLNVLAPYMLISFDYRCTSSGDIPRDAVIYVKAGNENNSQICELASFKAYNAKGWKSYTVKPVSGTFRSGWKSGYFSLNAYSASGFSNSVNIDIRNVQISLDTAKWREINNALANVSGVEKIENFTSGKVITYSDYLGTNDFYGIMRDALPIKVFDANDDGEINIIDLVRTKRNIAYDSFNDTDIMRMDTNTDGEVNAEDLAALKEYIFNNPEKKKLPYIVSLEIDHPGVVDYDAKYTLKVTDRQSGDQISSGLTVTTNNAAVTVSGLDLTVPYSVRSGDTPLTVKVINSTDSSKYGEYTFDFVKFTANTTFSDDFDTIDETIWNLGLMGDGEQGEITCEDSEMIFRIKKTSDTMKASSNYTQAYGCFSSRIRMPQYSWGQGNSAFWLATDISSRFHENKYVPHHSGGEIDIVEFYGDRYGKKLWSSVVHWYGWGKYHMKNGSVYQSSRSDLKGTYHVYSGVWTPEGAYTYLDGELGFVYKGEGIGKNSEGARILFSYFDNQNSRLYASDEMRIDWVKAWGLK